MMSTLRDGLWVYLDSSDLRHQSKTVARLRRCGAVGALPCIEGNNGRRANIDDLLSLQETLYDSDIGLHPFTFPSVLGDLVGAREWFVQVCTRLRVSGQLDAEPGRMGNGVLHWSPALLAPWLDLDCLTTITTTRAEAPHLGPHDRPVFAQLEAETSLDTLGRALEIFERTTQRERLTLVSGLFDSTDNPRTLIEVGRDLARATSQARLNGKHAVWSAHVMSDAEADILREWSLDTWGPR